MPISGAAMWIATKGMQVEVDPYDEVQIVAALQELADQITSEHIRVVGRRDGKSEQVPAYLFVCPIAYLPSAIGEDLASSDTMALHSWAHETREIWENGFDDTLADRSRKHWELLGVARADVARLWAFDEARRTDARGLTRTGAPGRPSAMHLVVAEHERRIKSSEARISLSEEARHLANWLRLAYPFVPPATPKTIENRIRDRHRLYIEPRK